MTPIWTAQAVRHGPEVCDLYHSFLHNTVRCIFAQYIWMPKTYACAKFYPIARDFLRILTNIGSAACTSCKNRLQNLLPQVHAYRQSGGSVYSSKFGLTDSRHPTAIAQRRHQRWLCLQVSLAPSSCPARAAVAAIIVQQMIHYMLSPFHFAM